MNIVKKALKKESLKRNKIKKFYKKNVINIVKRDLKKEHLKRAKRKKVFNKINYVLFHHIDFEYFPLMISQFFNIFIVFNLFFTFIMFLDNTAFLPLVCNPIYLGFLEIAFHLFIITSFVSLTLDVVKSFFYCE